jgi:hypothetical protein
MEQAALDALERKLEEQVKERFPDDGVQRVVLLQHGDDPQVEPGGLWIRVFIKLAGRPGREESQARTLADQAWRDAHEAMLNELQREFAQVLPAARMLEFKFITDDNTVRRGSVTKLIGGSAADLAERQRGLTPVMARLGPVDLWTLDTLVTAGIAANRAEAVRWVLARIRERPGYQKLSERTRELDELKAQF